MFRKSTILALAAVASFGALALSSTSASAFGHFGGARFSGARVAGPHFAFHRSFAFRRIVRVYPPHHWRWHFVHRPYWVTPVVGTRVAPTYSTPVWNSCNCLTKQYTQDGAVVFKDVCTNEMAMNPPAADAAPQAPASLQQPLQQGYLQPQPQPVQ